MIKTPEDLKELVKRAQHVPAVALDTEFVWERTYFPQMSLVQLSLGPDDCHLIDVPEVQDLSTISELLENPKVSKVFHDAEQDLVNLWRITGAHPHNVFDTQCAAAFLGFRKAISLQELVKSMEIAELAKTETRTDWLKRPLSAEQLEYAADDVRYLLPLRTKILYRSEKMGRTSWITEELEKFNDIARYAERNPDEEFKRVKRTRGMSDREMAILRELGAWRDAEARNKDRPRSHIASDELLTAVTRLQPNNEEELLKLEGPFQKTMRRYSAVLLEAVSKGKGVPTADCPKQEKRSRSRNSPKIHTDKALEFIRTVCQEKGIDPVLVASRSHVAALVGEGHRANPKDHPLLRGWRKELLGQEFAELMWT